MRHCTRLLAGVTASLLLSGLAPSAGADVTYELGPATDLLDAAFYAGEASDGSDVAGRWALFPRASNDGTIVAFSAMNIAAYQIALFLVDLGDPSSWRRLTDDLPFTAIPVYWTPDDLHLIWHRYLVPLATGELQDYEAMMDSHIEDTSVSRMATGNWIMTRDEDYILAAPILSDGRPDEITQPLREKTIVAQLPGLRAAFPHIARDTSMAAFYDWHPNQPEPAADLGDVYVIDNLDAILAAPKVPGTDRSTLAPTTWGDPNLIPIETGENTSAVPVFSEDLELLFYSTDFKNVFRYDDFIATVHAGDWDIVVRNADGSGSDYRIVAAENQSSAVPTPGGMRVLFLREQEDAPDWFVIHAMVSTLTVHTDVTGDVVGDPADNDILTTTDQDASDSSGTTVDVPSGTTVDFPVGEPQEILIETPIGPVEEAELPPDVDAIPVVRDFGPEGTQFAPPISVTITYTDEEVAGVDEATLRVFQYNGVSGVYDIEVTTITGRNLENNTITFSVDHFSSFGLAAVLEQRRHRQ